jgi:TetR/AcrR family transcriptional regulator
METMRELLEKGERTGVFRSGIDPVDLYISISALSSHYISHQYTFEAIFKQPMMEDARLRQRIDHAVDMVLRYLKP